MGSRAAGVTASERVRGYKLRGNLEPLLDDGHAADIPAMETKQGYALETNPYNDVRRNHMSPANHAGAGDYIGKSFGRDQDRVSGDHFHGRTRTEDHPSAAYSQRDMIAMRNKAQADGRYEPVRGPSRHIPIDATETTRNPAQPRAIREFEDAENARAQQQPQLPFGEGNVAKPQGGEFRENWNEFDPKFRK